jgi:hypothetical protein
MPRKTQCKRLLQKRTGTGVRDYGFREIEIGTGHYSREAPEHRIVRTCWYCYSPQMHNVVGLVVGTQEVIRPRSCPGCGHRADVPMRECDCEKCKDRTNHRGTENTEKN